MFGTYTFELPDSSGTLHSFELATGMYVRFSNANDDVAGFLYILKDEDDALFYFVEDYISPMDYNVNEILEFIENNMHRIFTLNQMYDILLNQKDLLIQYVQGVLVYVE